MKRRPYAAALALALCLGIMSGASARHGPFQPHDQSNAGWPIGALRLLDQHGQAFTEEHFLGRWTFVLLGDTRCGQRCAAPLAALAGMYQRIADTEALKTTQVLFVSFDAARDSPVVLRNYLARFDARFVGATGSPSTLQGLADDLGASLPDLTHVRLPDAAGDHHETSLVLVGPDGAIRAEFLPPFTVELLTAAYLKTRLRR